MNDDVQILQRDTVIDFAQAIAKVIHEPTLRQMIDYPVLTLAETAIVSAKSISSQNLLRQVREVQLLASLHYLLDYVSDSLLALMHADAEGVLMPNNNGSSALRAAVSESAYLLLDFAK